MFSGIGDSISGAATSVTSAVSGAASSAISSITGMVDKAAQATGLGDLVGKSAATGQTKLFGDLIKQGAVYGTPPRFLPTADPHSRLHMQMMSPPPVVNITPGGPAIFGSLDDKQKEVAKKLLSKWSEDSASSNQSLLTEVYNDLAVKSANDGRLLKFESRTSEYLKVLAVLLGRVGARFGNKVMNTSYSTSLNKWGSIMMYLDKSSSFNESGSSEYGSSIFSSIAKMGTSFSQEFQSIRDLTGIAPDQEKALAARQKEMLSDLVGADPNGVWSKVGAALAGDQLSLPSVWKDSSFGRSYSLSFKFETPYGDRDSIFRDVYTPFLMILAMCLPKQSSFNSYTAPFLVRVDCPGLFTIDCGAITNFSFKKSTDHLTYENLTRCIEVSIEVTDMYPALLLSPDYETLSCNFGMMQYLDNLASVDYTRQGNLTSAIDRVHASLAYYGMNATGAFANAKATINQAIGKAVPFLNVGGR